MLSFRTPRFAVLVHDCAPAEAVEILNDLRTMTPLGQTFSAGVAEWDGQESPERLVGRADVGLYEAKRAGRDRVVMAPSPPDDDPHTPAADPTRTETAPERRQIDIKPR